MQININTTISFVINMYFEAEIKSSHNNLMVHPVAFVLT